MESIKLTLSAHISCVWTCVPATDVAKPEAQADVLCHCTGIFSMMMNRYLSKF